MQNPIVTEIRVGVAHNESLSFGFRGSQERLLSLVGAMDQAKAWLLRRYQKTNEIDMDEGWAEEHPQRRELCSRDEVAKLAPMSKQDATDALLTARSKIDDRLRAIVRSDDRATFRVDTSLLEKL